MAHHLVIQLARFGDTIQTKRLLLSLAATPGDTVHLAVDPSLAAFARRIYPFAVVHEVRAHATNLAAAEAFSRNRSVFAALAEIPFSSVYTLNFSGMALALAGLFDPDSVRGYSCRNGQAFRSRWLRMGFRWMGNRRMAPMNLVDFWAYLHPDPVAPSAVNPAARAGGGGKIAVVASGREARRSLPPEVLAPLVEAAFVAHGGPEIVILGSNAERVFARKLSRLFRPAVLQKVDDACGRTSLSDLPDILAGCDRVLTPDTGIMHLAAHMGVPVQAFFLSSAWCFETGPYGDGHTVFQATRSCAPCVETRPCPHAVACLSPFASPALHRAVQGKEPETWPEELARFRTHCDAFGCDYIPDAGTLPELTKRAALRSLLAEYCGIFEAGAAASRFAETVFHETDWMLPPVDESGRAGILPQGE
ncbi:Glycosyl transferase family 9 [uncultured delta proteobacterium]|uniref:Glycosyl transferase family 9 n=1 Tax=uncultured delta proteobacterium TaxID=34034 RepID=A0A212J1S2_9DELT|nr:Glycosyl transferase family 9 [uncultured delta proteobacterium]